MSYRIVFSIAALTLTTSINAGWFDDTFGDSDKVQKKIEAVKETVKNGNTATDIKKVLSNEDIVAGLKEALNKGASYAVDNLGKTDGFLKNGDVKIPMPKKLKKVESLLRKAGKDKYADKFVIT
ncbi:MAG: DUF4197 family protein, partial [Gammaproteobacteria bacterium]|nr:DUF4197 family protein [Gammaproteobacteria bacterium]